MISVNRITYGTFSSKDFDLKTCLAFDSDSGEAESFLTREAVASESYRGEFKRIHNFKYTEVFSPQITFIKEDFSDFTLEEQRQVLKWLTSTPNASFLTVYYDDSEVISWEALGGFTEITPYKLGNGRTVGIVATFESATPWALSPLKKITKSLNGGWTEDGRALTNTSIQGSTSTVTFNVASDEPQSLIYPRITIEQSTSADTTVSITNTYTDSTNVVRKVNTIVKNNIAGETIILDGANRVVSSSRPNGRIFGDDFVNWTWMPLFDGENTISVTGNCVVTMEYRLPIKCGEF